MALLLNTSDPSIRNLKDYIGVTGHKIAMPAVKVSAHAIILEMAVEKTFGTGKQFVLDSLTVSMPHPMAYAALMSGHSEIRSHFANMPYSYFELHSKEKRIHTVISSYNVMGGAHSNVLLYATKKWVEENPRLLKAVFDAIVEADNWINANPGKAAKLFKRYTKSKFELGDIEAMIRDRSENEYAPEPKATMKFAQFMYKVGLIKKKPRSWKDYFWDIAHRMQGS